MCLFLHVSYPLKRNINLILKVPIWLYWKHAFFTLNVLSSEMTIRYYYFSMWFLCILGTWDCTCPLPINEEIIHFYWPRRSAEWQEQKTNTECMSTCILVIFFFPGLVVGFIILDWDSVRLRATRRWTFELSLPVLAISVLWCSGLHCRLMGPGFLVWP